MVTLTVVQPGEENDPPQIISGILSFSKQVIDDLGIDGTGIDWPDYLYSYLTHFAFFWDAVLQTMT